LLPLQYAPNFMLKFVWLHCFVSMHAEAAFALAQFAQQLLLCILSMSRSHLCVFPL